MLILDTNAIIGYLADDSQLVKLIDTFGKQGEAIGIPAIVITELLSYDALTEDHRLRIDEFIRAARVLPLTEAIASMAAKIRRMNHLTTIDAVIAATTLFTENGRLVTRDRAFQRIRSITILGINGIDGDNND